MIISTVPSQQWDHHVKDSFKRNGNETGQQNKPNAAWDGARRSKPSTVRELERAGKKGYGTAGEYSTCNSLLVKISC